MKSRTSVATFFGVGVVLCAGVAQAAEPSAKDARALAQALAGQAQPEEAVFEQPRATPTVEVVAEPPATPRVGALTVRELYLTAHAAARRASSGFPGLKEAASRLQQTIDERASRIRQLTESAPASTQPVEVVEPVQQRARDSVLSALGGPQSPGDNGQEADRRAEAEEAAVDTTDPSADQQDAELGPADLEERIQAWLGRELSDLRWRIERLEVTLGVE